MSVRIIPGDCRDTLKTLPDGSVHCCVTSPPYFGLRDYGNAVQIGLEPTPDEFIAQLVAVFREVRRVLRDDGTLWVNMGDSYAANRGSGAKSVGAKQATNVGANLGRLRVPDGCKEKDLIGVPWMLAFALRADGWYLRQDIIWSKPNPMPESVRDRCTKAHEYLFLLSKSPRYYCDMEAIKEPATCERMRGSGPMVNPGTGREDAATGTVGDYRSKRDSFKRDDSKRGVAHVGQTAGTHRPDREESAWDIGARNKRSVWEVATQPFAEAHFATFPPALIEPCILAGCPEGGTVLDPFGGAGTTGLVADRLQRSAILCELNPAYIAIADKRITGDAPLFVDLEAV